MMKLLSSPLSPYGRKVKMTLQMKGLADKVEIVVADTSPGDNVEINSTNPLGKVPALIVDGNTSVAYPAAAQAARARPAVLPLKHTAFSSRAARRTRAISPCSALRIAASRLPARSHATIVSQIATPHARTQARRSVYGNSASGSSSTAPRIGQK